MAQNTSAVRYDVDPVRLGSAVTLYNIHDCLRHRTVATAYFLSDAMTIAAKLNAPEIDAGYRRRGLLAMELYAFRLMLENENQAPLTENPGIAFLLDDLCTFFGFNTGQRAIVLGSDLLVLLNAVEADRVECETPDQRPIQRGDQLVIIEPAKIGG